jgi:hypothetical protein
MIGAKTLVMLTLLSLSVAAAVVFGVLAPERLAGIGAGTLFFAGGFAVAGGALIFRFWRLGEPSLHYFRLAARSDPEEAHFVGGDRRHVALGDNRGEAFDLGPRTQRAICVALTLLFALACADSRALDLLDGFRRRFGNGGATYCPEAPAQATPVIDPNLAGCELMRRAHALGYVKSLGQCAPREPLAATAPPCTRRQRDEPALHYAWRLLDRAWSKLRATPARPDFGAQLARAGERSRAELEVLSSAPHASHHLWTNLPDPGDGAFRAETCADRYRWLAHRPSGDGSRVFEHVLAQLLFESRYEPSVGSCREFHVHWNAPPDACKRLAADPSVVGALPDVAAVLERARSAHSAVGFLSFQCYFEDAASAPTTTPFDYAGQGFTVEEIHVAPAKTETDRYHAVARLLVPGFHYGALLSEAGIPTGAPARFDGHDYLLTRLYGLDSVDIYLDAGILAARPDLVEVYPYERHLRNYVQLFRRQYTRVRGRL